MKDDRVRQMAEHQRALLEARREAEYHTAKRDILISALRAYDPETWTIERLARELGVSTTLIVTATHRENGTGGQKKKQGTSKRK